ncbi:MAG: hypothetical protein EOO38_07425 [Cytophagaceae bacterium]|nr:MAG: hypothetical protein EOO38_07425 [Cytophagaceae bacterium]
MNQLLQDHAPLPLRGPIKRVKIITSQGSRGARDLAFVLDNDANHTFVSETIAVTVSDALSVASGIMLAAEDNAPMVVTRGGGDSLSLDVFNSEAVLRAVHYAVGRVPVILAVAHSQDTFFAERLCTTACGTPSEAGRLIRDVHFHWARANVQKEEKLARQQHLRPPPLYSDFTRHEKKAETSWLSKLIGLIIFSAFAIAIGRSCVG